MSSDSELFNAFLKYCDDHSLQPFNCTIMSIKIFIEFVFKNLDHTSIDIQKFLCDLGEKHSAGTALSTHPLIFNALQILAQRQEIRIQLNENSQIQKPSKACAVCQVNDQKNSKRYGSQYYTCNACQKFYKICLMSASSPKQEELCQGECDIIGTTNRKSCGACRFSVLDKLGMQIPDLSTKLR